MSDSRKVHSIDKVKTFKMCSPEQVSLLEKLFIWVSSDVPYK